MNPQTPVLVAAALVPAVFLLAWLNWKGRPWWTILAVLALGAAASVPAVYLERALTLEPWNINNVGKLFLFAVIVAGVVEEGCKFALVVLGPSRWGWIREEYDGILYAGTLSLGFASIENVMYVLQGGLQTATVRAFTAVPAHVAFGVIMGSYLGLARVRQRVGWSSQGLPLVGLAWAVVLHGVYDLFAFQGNSPLAPWLIAALLGGTAVWCVRRASLARCRSAFYGGVDMAVPPPLGLADMRIPAVPVRRDPFMAWLLGLVPGLGQFYNGERSKAAVFLAIAVMNLALFGVAEFFEHWPDQAAQWMVSLGFFLDMKPQDLVAAFEQKTVMPTVMLLLTGVWLLIGAAEAYLSASMRWNDRREYAQRRSFAPLGFGTAYLVHLVVALFLVLAPVLASPHSGGSAGKAGGKAGGAGGQQEGAGGAGKQGGEKGGNKDGQKWDLTWVGAPVRVQGWNPGSEGRGDGKGRPEAEVKPTPAPVPSAAPVPPSRPKTGAAGAEARPPATKPGRAPGGEKETLRIPTHPRGSGQVVVREAPQAPRKDQPTRSKQPWGTQGGDLNTPGPARSPVVSSRSPSRHGIPSRGSDGIPKSYNDYLSYKVREAGIADHYFRHVPPHMWTVVRYKVAANGSLLDARVVKSNGFAEDAARVVTVIEECAPFLPLPENARSIEVTELFWSGGSAQFQPGSLEEQLSRLPDGRSITVE